MGHRVHPLIPHGGLHACRTSWEIPDISALPEGFPVSVREWLTAVFVPGESNNGARSAVCPPRVYLLTHESLYIYAHESWNQPPIVVPLRDLAEIELDEMPIYATLRFWTNHDFHRVRYCSTQHRFLRPFFYKVRRQWLPAACLQSKQLRPESGIARNAGPCLRCWYALQFELDAGELLYHTCLQAEIHQRNAFLRIGPMRHVPAHLLAITNFRLIYIAEKIKDGSGLTVRYCSPANLQSCDVAESKGGYELNLSFGHGQSWALWYESCRLTDLRAVTSLLRRLATESEPLL